MYDILDPLVQEAAKEELARRDAIKAEYPPELWASLGVPGGPEAMGFPPMESVPEDPIQSESGLYSEPEDAIEHVIRYLERQRRNAYRGRRERQRQAAGKPGPRYVREYDPNVPFFCQ